MASKPTHAMARAISSDRMALEAAATASSPEPQGRLTVTLGTVTGNHASSSAIQATLRLSSPA